MDLDIKDFKIRNVKKYLECGSKISINPKDMIDKKVLKIIEVINEKDKKNRYSLIYDYISVYLDKDMQEKNFCSFENGKCIASRKRKTIHEYDGCCWQRGVGHCNNLNKNGLCSINSISCKLFICSYLQSKGIKYNVKKIFPLKYFFNRKQINTLKRSYFKSKEETISLLLSSEGI